MMVKLSMSTRFAGFMFVVILLMTVNMAAAENLQSSKDVYYKTNGIPMGPPAPTSEAIVYPRYGSFDSRLLVWFITQQHTYFGGFVLALPIFCVIMEFAGLMVETNRRRYAMTKWRGTF